MDESLHPWAVGLSLSRGRQVRKDFEPYGVDVGQRANRLPSKIVVDESGIGKEDYRPIGGTWSRALAWRRVPGAIGAQIAKRPSASRAIFCVCVPQARRQRQSGRTKCAIQSVN
ncbi:hypothetical protein [Paracoccus sediminis]|uniref:hypothetical protein n=1 Tax=Paracoccus sediminis TaxID=1214787 RepID=UPI0010353606|nr:hypothetical protein [Paracoccus sediminis]